MSRGPEKSSYNLLADKTDLWGGADTLTTLWCHADDSKLFDPQNSSILASLQTAKKK